MHTIVDGYNILMVQPECHRRLRAGEMQRARKRLLDMLRRYQVRHGGRLTVVFDSPSSRKLQGNSASYAGIEVLFAPPGSDADSVIVGLVHQSSRPSDMRVATSDRAVRTCVKRAGAKVVGAMAFLRELKAGLRTENKSEPREKFSGLAPDEIGRWLEAFGFREKEK